MKKAAALFALATLVVTFGVVKAVDAQFASPTCVPPTCNPTVIQNVAIGSTAQSASINITGDGKFGATFQAGASAPTLSAAAQNLIYGNVAGASSAGNLMKLQVGAADRFIVDLLGNVAMIGDLDVRGGDIRNTVGGTVTVNGNLTVTGTTNFSGGIGGDGSALTNLNASNLTSGTVPGARLAGTYANAITLNNPANVFYGNGANLTGIVASTLAAGTYANAYNFNNPANTFNGTHTGTGTFTTLTVGGVGVCRQDGTNCPASSGLGGAGTTNYIAKWTSAGAIGNSSLYDNAGFVGIGTATPGTALDVNGTIRANNNVSIASWPGYGTGQMNLWYDGPGGTNQNAPDTLHFAGGQNVQVDNGNLNVAGIVTGGSFVGVGSGLSNVTASNLAAGSYGNLLNFTNPGNTYAGIFNGTFSGNGASITNVTGANVTGTVANATNAVNATNASGLAAGTYANAYSLTNVGNSFTGNGGGLTNLNPANFAVGTLSANVSVPWSRLNGFPAGCPGGQFVTSVGGVLTCAAPAASGLGGAGTANTIPLWTAGTTLGNSILTQSGATITVAGTMSGTFSGNGAGLTSVTASGLAAGIYANAYTFNNASNTINGTHTGTGTFTTLTVGGTNVCLQNGANCPASSGVGGAGSANYVAKWSNGSTLTWGTLYDNGNVGINTAGPSYKLDVNGQARVGLELGVNGSVPTVGYGITTTGGYGIYSGGTTAAGWFTHPGTGTYAQIAGPAGSYNYGLYTNANILALSGGICAGGACGSPSSMSNARIIATGSTAEISWMDRTQGGFNDTQRWAWYANGGWTALWNNGNQPLQVQQAAPTSTLNISNAGRVGVGTTAPAYKLEVAGPGGSSVDFRANGRIMTGDGTNQGGVWMGSAATQFVGQADPNTLGMWNNGLYRLLVANNGYVGLGSAAPTLSLDVTTPSMYGSPAIGGSNGAAHWAYMHVSSGDHSLIWNSGSAMRFGTEPSKGSGYVEWARFDPNGRLGIGTGGPAYKLDINSGADATGMRVTTPNLCADTGAIFTNGANNTIIGDQTCGGYYRGISTSGNGGFGGYVSVGNASGFLNINYQLYVIGNAYKTTGGGSWAGPSDQRLKKNIADFSDGLDVIRKLHLVKYEYNGLGGTQDGAKGVGVIAQEAQKVVPYMVQTNATKLHPNDAAPTEILSFDPSAMDFINANAIKTLDITITNFEAKMNEKNDEQDARLKALEDRVDTLQQELNAKK